MSHLLAWLDWCFLVFGLSLYPLYILESRICIERLVQLNVQLEFIIGNANIPSLQKTTSNDKNFYWIKVVASFNHGLDFHFLVIKKKSLCPHSSIPQISSVKSPFASYLYINWQFLPGSRVLYLGAAVAPSILCRGCALLQEELYPGSRAGGGGAAGGGGGQSFHPPSSILLKWTAVAHHNLFQQQVC